MLPGIAGIGGLASEGLGFEVIATGENVVSATTLENGVYNTSVQVAAHSADDLIIVVCNSVQGAVIDSANPPPGFTKLVERSDVNGNTGRTQQSVVYYKVAGSDQLTASWHLIPVLGYSPLVCTNAALVVSGADTLSPNEIDTGTDFVSANDPSAPNINLTAGKRLILTTLFVDDDVYPTGSPYPPGYKGFHNRTQSDFDQALWVAYEIVDASGGLYNPGAFEATISFGDKGTMTTTAFKKAT